MLIKISFGTWFLSHIDESIIKSYHHDLKDTSKIIRKPLLIGSEIKDIYDSVTNIVLHLELYEGREIMSQKDFVKEYGATDATTLQLTDSYHDSGRRIIADSGFGSVKTVLLLPKWLMLRCILDVF